MTSDNRRTPETSHASGTRRPEYVVVIAASDRVKERFPVAGANLYDALQAGKDHREPEIDLEAEQ